MEGQISGLVKNIPSANLYRTMFGEGGPSSKRNVSEMFQKYDKVFLLYHKVFERNCYMKL